MKKQESDPRCAAPSPRLKAGREKGKKMALGNVAPYLMREEQLAAALEQAQKNLAELQQEESNRLKWPRELRLAMKLHDNLCQSRDCDFHYQFDKDGIRETSGIAAEPTQYRRMADLLMHYCEAYKCPLDELLNIFNLKK
jgi:hypothetical protein